MENLKLFNDTLAQKAEQLGQLPEEWLQEIYHQKWFKLFVPQEFGGLEASFPEALLVEEKLASLDGSLGWTVTLCSGAGWFVGFMEESLRNEVFPHDTLCLAGSGFVGGRANRVGDRYVISGSWTYASGALHATHFTANCEILEGGKPVLDAAGNPIIKAFILDEKDVEILDGWNYMGMVATGSHAFRTQNLSVNSNRCFEVKPDQTQLENPVYKIPFLQFAEATLAVNILGISAHMTDLIEKSFWKRHEYRKYDEVHLQYFKKLHQEKREKLEKLRTKFYSTIEVAWKELVENGQISPKSLRKISKISRKLTQKCREINGLLYPFAGLEAAKTHTELNRVWRDFNTVSQHALLIFPF